MSTPHIAAPAGAFAELVLLPGDPLRARHVATTLLKGAVEVTAVRNMLGFTGEWQGRRVSVMGAGIGIPSCVLYATELVREYGVRRLVRVGTCGAIVDQVGIGELVLAAGAGTDSAVNRLRFRGYDFGATASWGLLSRVAAAAGAAGKAHVGRIFSTDFFYHPDAELVPLLRQYGFLALDMETAGLYGAAAELGVEALSVLTVSDHLSGGQHMSPEQRETGVDAMVRLVLDALL
jgi:purine-nucleoside phosphorylase